MDQEFFYRYSRENDIEQLEKLFLSCFGDLAKNSRALENIEGRYMVAVLTEPDQAMQNITKETIVAVSGILPIEQSEYQGYEVTWTCTLAGYRKKGLIVEILKRCEQTLPDDHLPIFCDCWRIRDNVHINMFSVMKHLGFKEVINSRIKRNYSYSRDCIKCTYEEKGCYCFGDLYMKER